jgi:glutamyl/glutaminyl-tRNA synthetase
MNPVWAHLPVIVNERRQKPSKRRDKVGLEDYLAGAVPAAGREYGVRLLRCEEAGGDADWTAETLRSGLEAAAAEHGRKLGQAQEPVRVAVSGRTIGLPLFESVELLGRERTLAASTPQRRS